ncbi:F-box/FBD/LRR-repeat protein At4g26340 isoform X1 [Brassica napus]|nr:F-box/FBD/LRR-repeat protein At4g26340 isoform X1 [Brassica napus]XP_013703459.1 F-box/FBD/LRR-repeat protein At4g26340 isoform X1 [Brassica napus]
MENMPALVEASVCITTGVTQKFLKALTSVHCLSLYLSFSEVVHPSGMIFNQLVHLDLYTFTEGWWDLLTCMLQDSPKLRLLKLSNTATFSPDSTDLGEKYQMLKVLASVATTSASSQLLFD